MPSRTRQRLALVSAFLTAAWRYWVYVFPVARAVVRRLRTRAGDIPDRVLRRLAIQTEERKWDSEEGAAVFAAFVDRGRRAMVARLLVRIQAIYDYADTLMEQPAEHPARNARQLHEAILTALEPGRPHPDYYAYHAREEDDGYLVDLVDACRDAVDRLPSYALVAERVLRHARRIVYYQSAVNLAASDEDYAKLELWTTAEDTPPSGLVWWELAAAAGSSLGVFALLAAAADPALTDRRAEAIDALYWPWLGVLHTLLDSLVDHAEDMATGQHNLLCHYSSAEDMARRLERLALEADRRASAVGAEHRLILAGVTGFYLSHPRAWVPFARDATERILASLDDLGRPATLVLRARRLIHRPD